MKPMEFETTPERVSCHGRVDQILLCVSGSKAITDTAMGMYIDFIVRSVKERGPFDGAFLFMPIHGPSTAQRRMLTERSAETQLDRASRIALLSDSAIVRGGITAIYWLTRGKNELKAFRPVVYRDAFEWLAAKARFDQEALLATLNTMIDTLTLERRHVERDWRQKLLADGRR
jgi:hypothetical protein